MMNKTKLLPIFSSTNRVHLLKKNFSSASEKKETLPAPTTKVTKKPALAEVNETNAVFDKITHTGQAWDQADYRLSRFTFSEKTVNPNIAAHLIAEQPPISSEESVVWCDGGHPALGHPRVYINLDKPGTHACGYCGLRYYNLHSTKSKDLNVAHIQV